MKHETEHLIRVSPDESSQIEERRQSQASVSIRDKAAAYDLLHDAVEGNPFNRLGMLERVLEDLSEELVWAAGEDGIEKAFPDIAKAFTVVEQHFDLLELCLQRYASVLLQAQITNIAQRQAGEDVNRSPEAMRRCEKNANE